MAGQAWVGFYWTLPVPWAGFTALPGDIEAAAKASRTIRYQRDRVRRWVAEEKDALVDEAVFLELAPDRGTAYVKDAVAKATARCKAAGAGLVLVDFRMTHGWRAHPALWEALEETPVPQMRLDPVPLLIDGQTFDPLAHFRTWAAAQDAHAQSKPAHKAQIKAALGDAALAHTTLAETAARLNAAGLRTHTGKPWTADNLRKFMQTL